MSTTNTTPDIRVTSLNNIRKFQDRSGQLIASLETEMHRAQRYKRDLSILLVNVVGSTRGGSAQASNSQLYIETRLRKIAPSILRMPDFWGRVDRENFVLVLPETPQKGAEAAAMRLVNSEEFSELMSSGKLRVVLSTAQCSDETVSVKHLVRAARENQVWSSVDSDENV